MNANQAKLDRMMTEATARARLRITRAHFSRLADKARRQENRDRLARQFGVRP